MKNKIELKKTLWISVVVILIFSIIFGMILYKEYQVYTKEYNQKISAIVNQILTKYPEKIEKNEIIAILNAKTNLDDEIFKQYGIDLEKDAVIEENQKYFHQFFALEMGVLFLFALTIIGTFLYDHYKRDQKLKEITKYIEQINQKNYQLDIEDNTEDELSILKNELYKTAIMLKEAAENSAKDKLNLKNSLSDISHQLKTPITSIMIMLDNILEDEQMEIEVRNDFIKDIRREITNIQFLVESLLKLSKLDSNSVSFIKKEVKLKKILLESSKNIAMLCDLKNIKISIYGREESTILCDFKWQVEAITNILKNCVEHSKEGGKVEIFYEQNQLYTKIEIIDEGKGIEKQDLPHIFERFYKGSNSSNDSVGIGLALAKLIIESSNGYISVESKIGVGTKFMIRYIT